MPAKTWNKPVDLTLKHTLDTANGLLAPTGVLFACEWGKHRRLAERLGCEEYSYEIYNFIHLQDAYFDRPNFKVSQAQLDTIFDWCVKFDKKLPNWATNHSAKSDSERPNVLQYEEI